MYQPFSHLHWHFPCHNYLEVTHINARMATKNKNVLDLTKVFELSGFASVCRHNVSSTGVATLLGYSFVCGTK